MQCKYDVQDIYSTPDQQKKDTRLFNVMVWFDF